MQCSNSAFKCMYRARCTSDVGAPNARAEGGKEGARCGGARPASAAEGRPSLLAGRSPRHSSGAGGERFGHLMSTLCPQSTNSPEPYLSLPSDSPRKNASVSCTGYRYERFEEACVVQAWYAQSTLVIDKLRLHSACLSRARLSRAAETADSDPTEPRLARRALAGYWSRKVPRWGAFGIEGACQRSPAPCRALAALAPSAIDAVARTRVG